jgi:hypothetical protein
VSVLQLLVVGLAPAPKKRTAQTGGTTFGVVVVVIGIREDSGRGPVVTGGKWLIPFSEDILTGLYDGML